MVPTENPGHGCARTCHLLAVAFLVALGVADVNDGWAYGTGGAVAAALLACEQSLVRADNLSRVNVAFFVVNGLVSVTLAAFTVADVLTG